MSALTPRGSTYAWRKLRERVLARDRSVCRWCGGYADTVDHVLPRAQGGGDDEGNLVAACRRCNSARGARMGRTGSVTPSRGW
jgi:5-methylcytosine-specific restriction endonuclease McrA